MRYIIHYSVGEAEVTKILFSVEHGIRQYVYMYRLMNVPATGVPLTSKGSNKAVPSVLGMVPLTAPLPPSPASNPAPGTIPIQIIRI